MCEDCTALLARMKRMEDALKRIVACLSQSEHNAIIALQIAEQWEHIAALEEKP